MNAPTEPAEPSRGYRADGADPDPDALHTRWCETFTALSAQVQRLHLRSQIYEPLDEAIVAQAKPGSALVVDVLRSTYAEAQATCVRRLIGNRRGEISLLRLVQDMANHPTVLSRRRFVAHFQRPDDPYFAEYGNRDFDELAGAAMGHVPKATLLALRAELVAAGKVVKNYVDDHVAHTRPTSPAHLTFGELKTAIHEISGCYQRVGLMLTATHYEYVPVIQDPWEQVFSEPLFPPWPKASTS